MRLKIEMKRQLDQRLTQLKKGKNAEPVTLDRFRQLLKQELQQDDSRKLALHALIERITAYPDRKMEVDFRLGESEKETAGEDKNYPRQSTYPLRDLNPRYQRERLVSLTWLDEEGIKI